MALVTRRYRKISTTDANAQAFVAPSAAVVAQYVNSIDLQVDDAVGGTTDSLDEYMDMLGYVYDPTAAGPLPSFFGLGHWTLDNNFGSSTSTLLNIGPANTSYQELIMPRNGYLLSATSYVTANAVPAGGLITYQPQKGAATTPIGSLSNIVGSSWTMDDVSFPWARVVNWTPGLYPILAGEKFAVRVTTNGNTGANNYVVNLEVGYSA
jgi:hypothetical protein